MAIPTRSGIVNIDNSVENDTSPTDRSTSLPYFAANIEFIAAAGADTDAVRAMAIVGSSPNPRAATNADRTIDGTTRSLNTVAASAGTQRK